MSRDRDALHAAIAALEAQRAALGDAVVDAALAPLRRELGQAAPQLRLVSVLFLDIVGSTSLTQHLDPEQVHDVMDGALAAYTEQVRAHDGTVLQYAGDSLLAVFGHPRSREDDAARCVRCALALLEAARVQAERVHRRHGHDGFDVRIGIHTGRVLLGAGVDADHGIRGMTVNVAARLEQAADPGTLLISHDTWRHVEGLFDTEQRPPMRVKGRDAPLTSWRVLRERPSEQAGRRRGIDGVSGPLTGRDEPLGALLAAWGATPGRGQPCAVLVVAEAGLGKSRLAAEFVLHAESGVPAPAAVWQARAHAAQQLQPYRLLRDLLTRWLTVSDSDDADAARSAFAAGLTPWLDGDDAAVHRLGQLVGLDHSASPHVAGADPRQLRDWGQAALERIVLALTARRGGPLLILADDLHWADAASVDALQKLLDAPSLPLMVLALARPTLLEASPWSGGLPRAWSALTLAPLAGTATRDLMQALLHRLQPVPPVLADALAERAGGNPYFLEELIKMLIDDGVIVVGREPGEAWRFHADRWAGAPLPTTLVGVLQARLDALEGPTRRALQQASIVGPVFWDEALASLDVQAVSALPELQHRALVRRREFSAFEGTAEEVFAHQLLQQVSYDAVLRHDKQAGHAAAARWLASRVSDRSGEHLAITARHFLHAGESATAARWFAAAADHAADRFDNATAFELLHQGLAASPDDAPDARWRLRQVQAVLADRVGDRTAHEEAVAALECLAAEHPDGGAAAAATGTVPLPMATGFSGDTGPADWPARARVARGLLAMRRGDHAQARQALDEAIERAVSCGDRRAAAEACNIAVVLARVVGDAQTGRERAGQGLALAREIGDRVAELRLVTNLGALDFGLGRHAVARRVMAESIPLAQRLNRPGIEMVLRVNITGCDVELGDADAVCREAPVAIALGRSLGDAVNVAVVQINHAVALQQQGRLDQAWIEADAALRALEPSGVPLLAVLAEHGLAQIEHDLGRHQTAADRHERLMARFDELDQPALATDSRINWVLALLGAGRRQAARDALQPVLQADGRDGDGSPLAHTPLWNIHRALVELGDERAPAWLARAGQALDAYLTHFDEPGRAERYLREHAESRAIRAARGSA